MLRSELDVKIGDSVFYLFDSDEGWEAEENKVIAILTDGKRQLPVLDYEVHELSIEAALNDDRNSYFYTKEDAREAAVNIVSKQFVHI